jgi:transcriptional regulator with XRE-family HTH domain
MNPQEAKSFGAFLRAEREKLGLSTHKVAELAAVDQATVSRIEAGKILAPRPDKAARIAAVLGISASDLYARAGYLVPADLPSIEPYLQARYPELLPEDVEEIRLIVERLASSRGATKKQPVSEGERSESSVVRV